MYKPYRTEIVMVNYKSFSLEVFAIFRWSQVQQAPLLFCIIIVHVAYIQIILTRGWRPETNDRITGKQTNHIKCANMSTQSGRESTSITTQRIYDRSTLVKIRSMNGVVGHGKHLVISLSWGKATNCSAYRSACGPDLTVQRVFNTS